MKILDIKDGKPVYQYEVGDHAQISTQINFLLAKDAHVVITESFGDTLEVASKSMRDNGWGSVCIEADHLIPAGKTKAQLPALLQAWKEDQVRKILGVEECLKKMKDSSKV